MPKLKERPGLGGHRSEMKDRIARAEEDNRKLAAEKKPPRPVGHFSGFCNDENELRDSGLPIAVKLDDLHARCRGGVTNEAGKFSPCVCPGHDSEFKCHQCGHLFGPNHEGDFDEGLRRCVGRDECAARIASASAEYRKNSPLHQQIDAIHAEQDARREAEREAGKEALREAGRRSAGRGHTVETQAEGVAAVARAVRERPQKTPQLCHEGCGGMTKGGRFMMGHDMKLKGQLFAIARSVDPAVDGKFAATDEIVARGWNTTGCDPTCLEHAGLLDPDDVIRDSVRARYGNDELEVH